MVNKSASAHPTYQVAVEAGTIKTVSASQLMPCPFTPNALNGNDGKLITLNEDGRLGCSCRAGCKTKTCSCRKEGASCSIYCHKGSECTNTSSMSDTALQSSVPFQVPANVGMKSIQEEHITMVNTCPIDGLVVLLRLI